MNVASSQYRTLLGNTYCARIHISLVKPVHSFSGSEGRDRFTSGRTVSGELFSGGSVSGKTNTISCDSLCPSTSTATNIRCLHSKLSQFGKSCDVLASINVLHGYINESRVPTDAVDTIDLPPGPSDRILMFSRTVEEVDSGSITTVLSCLDSSLESRIEAERET